ASLGGVEDRRGAILECRRRYLLGPVDQTRTSQQRGEILDFAMVIQHLVMQRGEEFRETHAFLYRDLLQRVPERHFQPDRRAMAAHSQGTGLRFIVALRLMCEQMAHGSLPGGSSF